MKQEYITRKYINDRFVYVVVKFFGHDFFTIWPFSEIFLRQLNKTEIEVMRLAEQTGTLAQVYKEVKGGKYVIGKEGRTNKRTGKNSS